MTELTKPGSAAGAGAPLPHVDPGGLITLFIRFVAANFLTLVTAYCLLRHEFVMAAPFALAATLTQRATVVLYRRMKDEYAAAAAAAAEQTAAEPSGERAAPAAAGDAPNVP